MAVLTNTMMQGTAADSGDEDYQIEKNLRFNNADQTNLKTTPGSSGNAKTWTISVWVKRSMPDTADKFFMAGDTSDETGLRFDGDALHFYRYDHPSYSWQLKTNALFRDPFAWYHITAVYDSTNPVQTERLRLYVNGKRQTSFSTADYFNQNTDSTYNTAIEHTLGKLSNLNNTESFDGYMSDPQFIDGLALSPAAFGSFNDSNCWNPKAFELPTPNNGTTWTSSVTDTGGFLTPAANLFKGGLTIGAETNVDDTATFTPSTPIVAKQAIRVYGYWKTGTPSGDFDFKINGVSKLVEAVAEVGAATSGWYTLDTRTLTSLQFGNKTGSTTWMVIYAIEVDGVMLIDGQTDPTWAKWKAINTGKIWSTDTVGSFYSNMGLEKAFKGKVILQGGEYGDNTAMAANNAWAGWKPATDVVADTSIRVYFQRFGTDTHFEGNSATWCKLNDVNITSNILAVLDDSLDHGWVTLPTTGGAHKVDSTNGLQVYRDGTSGITIRIHAIEVDGVILTDGNVNSFHLKFNDTAGTRNLGYSQVMNTPTGAQPMYGTGASDSAKASLVYAIPGYDTVDHHPTIKGSGTAKALSVTGAVVSTTKAKLYGSSLYFDGSNDVITTPDHADFDMTSSDATIELWFNPHATSGSYRGIFSTSAGTGDGHTALTYGPSELRLQKSGVVGLPITISWTTGRWYHIAITRVNSSSTTKVYIDGVEKASSTSAFWSDSSATFDLGKYGSEFGGFYLNDFRVYKGVCKYTGAFTPPTRNDFTVSNLVGGGVSKAGYTINQTATIGAKSGQTGSDDPFDVLDGNPDSEFGQEAGTNVGHFSLVPINLSTPINGTFRAKIRQWGGSVPIGSVSIDGGSNYTAMSNDEWGNTWQTIGTASNCTQIILKVAYNGENGTVYWQTLDCAGTEIIAVDATSIDSFTDSPTNYTDDSDVAHGNYCTLNPLTQANNSGTQTFKEGNLYHESTSSAGAWHMYRGTMTIPKGSTDKFYYEVEWVQDTGNTDFQVGWVDPFQKGVTASGFGDSAHEYCFRGDNGKKFNNNTQTTYGNAPSQGDIVGVGYDNGSIRFWVNGTEQNSGTAAWTGIDKPLMPGMATYTQSNDVGKLRFNFGQRAFQFPQTDYKSICTQNIDDTFSGDEVNNPSKYFDIATYTGTGADDTDIKGFNFQPDLVWIKERDSTGDHHVFDAVRGATKALRTNVTDAQVTDANELKAFNSDGFRLGTGGDVNASGTKTVAWAWDAGTAANTSTNTEGDNITVAVGKQWVNATAGFSITEYAGDGSGNANSDSGDAVGHGLSAAPDFVVVKRLDQNGWPVYHSSLNSTDHMNLQTSNAKEANNYCYPTHPTNTKVDLGNNPEINNTGSNYIMYCWTAIPGYSAFGKYDGINDPTFIYTGFQPRWIMVKLTSETLSTGGWKIIDTERNPINEGTVRLKLAANEYEAENGNTTIANNEGDVDILSNGFRITDNHAPWNTSGRSYIWCAFAEHPFKTARAK